MTPENIARRNALIARIQTGEVLHSEERLWLQEHPIYSTRYGTPYIVADFIALEPGREAELMVQCLKDDPKHPIVPTFTIPFEKGGFVRLKSVAGSGADFSNMKKSTKLSLRMLTGFTATLQAQSDSGLIMVSYQGWVPDNKPFPLWFECLKCPRFAMEKTTFTDKMVQYGCCGAEPDGDPEEPGFFDKFAFLVNWESV